MMTDAERELVAEAIDGDLLPEREVLFRKLIAESAEAHLLYQQLTRDRNKLRALPRRAAPSGTHSRIMARVREQARPVAPAVRPVAPVRRPVWVPVGLAASLFLCTGATAFLYFRSADGVNRSVAQIQSLPKEDSTPSDLVTANSVVPPKPPRVPAEVPLPPRADNPDAVAKTPVANEQPVGPPKAPPTSGNSDLLTSPFGPEIRSFQSVQIRVPVLLPIADIATDEGKRQIAAELARDPAFRVDLFVPDTNRAAEALVTAARAINLTVSLDAIAHDRQSKRLPFAWAVATDPLTPDEVADWLAAAANIPGDGYASAARLTGTAHVIAAGPSDRKEWKDLVGVDPAWGSPPRGEAPASKSIASGTADQIAKSLLRPGSTKAEKNAVLVTYLPKEGRIGAGLSKEVKSFAERKAERKANAVPLLVVIRSPNT